MTKAPPPAKKRQEKPGPNQRDIEIEKLKNDVPIPSPTFSDRDQVKIIREYERTHHKISKWAETRTKEQVVEALVDQFFWKRVWKREEMALCEELATDRAKSRYQHINARRGKESPLWIKVYQEWISWQKTPTKFNGRKGFVAAMEAKYQGVVSGTLNNKITQWRRSSQNDES